MSRIQMPIALFGMDILPPTVALLLTVAFVIFLFRRDFREQANVTGALWLPLLWTLLIGSRSVAQWLSVLGLPLGASSAEEGNPIDALVYFTLIAAGIYVLNKRHVSLGEIFRNNGWLMAFVLYCFLAIAWSDFPFAAFKRWIKVLGHPVMVLILFTEPDPEESLTRLMKRSAYVLLPFSILFIKYFEGIGRQFDDWTGAAHNTGVAQNKNGLGGLCMVLGFFFFWRLLKTWRSERSTARRNELQLIAGLLFMIGYLLRKAHSATSFLGLLIAMLIMLLLNLRSVNKRLIGAYVLLAIVTLGVAELAFGIFEHIVDLTGHSDTINGRAELWHELLAFNASPIFGAGFESFWLGDRLRKIWETHWWHPTQAHNGYLETYLNLGVVGLLMLVGLIVATFLKIRTALLRNFEWGRFRLGLFIAIVLYNWTEAAFRGLSLIWFAFYIIAMEYPSLRFASMEPSPEATGSEEELELAYSEERI